MLLNFQGTAQDVMTLAHELGHGVHQYLARERGVLQQNTPLTTAETASIFGETLVFQDLLSRVRRTRGSVLSMLVRQIESSFATVFRQVAMNRFEEAVHTLRRTEGEIPAEVISRHWRETQEAMFGGSVTLTEDYGIWWSYIPHFIHAPGYVYAYAFGDLLVRALYARFQEAGPEFPDAVPGHARRRRLGLADRHRETARGGPCGPGVLGPGNQAPRRHGRGGRAARRYAGRRTGTRA